MRIAIIDDEEDVRIEMRRYIEEMCRRYWTDAATVQIDLFAAAEPLLKCFNKQGYDLVLLDICMAGIDGMEAARRLRAENADVGIIFLTSSEDYLLEGYRVFADGYFLKPLSSAAEDFLVALRRVFARRAKMAQALFVEYNGHALDVPFRKICYADIKGGRLHLVLENQEFCLARPFTYEWGAARLLSEECFLECYHRIIVNMDFIEQMEAGNFVLAGDVRLPISRRRSSAVKIAYMQYLLNK